MLCPNCKKNSLLVDWKPEVVRCMSNSCSETSGRRCPNCNAKFSHIYLDGQKEWRESEFYKPSGGS